MLALFIFLGADKKRLCCIRIRNIFFFSFKTNFSSCIFFVSIASRSRFFLWNHLRRIKITYFLSIIYYWWRQQGQSSGTYRWFSLEEGGGDLVRKFYPPGDSSPPFLWVRRYTAKIPTNINGQTQRSTSNTLFPPSYLS